MSKRKIYDFLRDLSANNSKSWMDENRAYYEETKNIWLKECDLILQRLAQHDDFFAELEARDTVERINNNLLYHPDKPTYKDHFGFSPSIDKGIGFYVSVSPAYSFIGGGIHNPSNEQLKPIRAAIDERGDELKEILADEEFKSFYGELEEDEKKLKTSPQGYDQDHEHIELLRRKNFTVTHRISQEEVIGDDFPKLVEKAYLKLMPFHRFIMEALG